MGKAFIQESTLTDIADAIRSKNGSSDTYLPSEMAQAIQNIPTGGDINYFYVEDASGAANTLTIKKSNNSLPDKVFDWSLDKQTWTTITVTDTTGVNIAVPANGRVYLRGDNGALAEGANYLNIKCSSAFDVAGDATTLISKAGRLYQAYSYAFRSLFYQATQLKHAHDLTLFTGIVADYCYRAMFSGCTSLLTAPILTATNTASNCYTEMFSGCTNLQAAPALPAVTLVASCYMSMFSNCKTLTEAADMAATTTAGSSLSSMYQGCTNLAKVVVRITTWNTSAATNWLLNVAPTGDFYNLGGATIPSGTNGIPSGWTEHTSL